MDSMREIGDSAAPAVKRAPPWAGPAAWRCEQRVDGDRLVWLQAGDGPPLLLLHGYGGEATWWRRNVAFLARARTVYALDLPGFGASRMRGQYTVSRSLDLVVRWMDLQNIGTPDVAGHSMGGQLAVLLAARRPERVRRLLLLAPAGLPFGTGLAGMALRAAHSRLGADPRFTPIFCRVPCGPARVSSGRHFRRFAASISARSWPRCRLRP